MFYNLNGESVKNISVQQDIIIWGVSEKNLEMLSYVKCRALMLIDIDKKKHGQEYGNLKVESPQIAMERKECIIITTLHNHADDIRKISGRNESDVFVFVDNNTLSKIETIKKSGIEFLERGKRSYSFVHWFPNTPFCVKFYDMIDENFDLKQHLFVLDYGNTLADNRDTFNIMIERAAKNGNVVFIDDYYLSGMKVLQTKEYNLDMISDRIVFCMKNAEKIILHSAYFGDSAISIMEQGVDICRDHLLWVVFGQDGLSDTNDRIIKNIIAKVECAVCKEEFVDRIKSRFGIKTYGSHWSYGYLDKDFKLIENISVADAHRNVLLGHSAVETNRIELGIKDMERYSNEDITIYCPLSYGEASYRDRIIKQGTDIFGDKFVAMTEYMNGNEYYKFLQTIDIGVFPMIEMKAGTTIAFLQSLGAKIYLRKEFMEHCEKREPLYDFWDYEILKSQNYNDFLNIRGKKDTKKVVEDNNGFIVKEWRNVFEL